MRKITENIRIKDYDYILPEERIAQHPSEERDGSKLLVFKNGKIREDIFRNVANHLQPDSLLVFNNTRVIRARLLFPKSSGAVIEIFCLEPLQPAEYDRSFISGGPVEWKCLVGNLKKWKGKTLRSDFTERGITHKLMADKVQPEGEAWRIRFTWEPAGPGFGEVMESAGHIPLPPYVKREDEKEDSERYQTLYGRINGSVAAPTAGLHFTDATLGDILKKGVKSAEITLHVGGGTFQPVRTNDITEHEMHCEHFLVSRETIKTLLQYRDRIIAVGTTSVRTLESLYWLGVKIVQDPAADNSKLFIDQWDPYCDSRSISVYESLEALTGYMDSRGIPVLHASTRIMIIPGYKFRMIRGMITNFHQPRSTLLLLVSAWAGNDWKKIYNYAMEKNFRFLSYGDTSLITK